MSGFIANGLPQEVGPSERVTKRLNALLTKEALLTEGTGAIAYKKKNPK